MLKHLRVVAACVAALLVATAALAQDEEPAPEPGKAVRDRTAADVALLLPQRGLGGSEKAGLDGEPGTPKAMKIESEGEGADKLKGYVATPPVMDKARKHALVFAFAGSGDEDTQADLKRVLALSQGRDPLIVCALQYRAAKDMGNGFVMLEKVAKNEVIQAGYLWLLKKIMKDYPVDPQRVFLLGASGGDDEAVEWSSALWQAVPDSYPFRAILLDGLVIAKPSDLAPVPMVLCVDADLAKMNAKFGGKVSPKAVVNQLMAGGIPCQYHEYAYQMMADSQRWQFILRDAIHTLGGPGAREYADQRPVIGVVAPSDAVPFADNNADPVVAEIVSIAKAEEWARAFKRLSDYLADKSIKAKDKKAVQDFQKEWDKYVKAEVERLNKSIETSIKAEAWAHSLHRARLAAMVEAFKNEKWMAGKPCAANLEKLKTYPPAVRDNQRREKVLEAVRKELANDRAGAKAIYQELAKQKAQDGGYSDWPRAAEYRLSWWEEVE